MGEEFANHADMRIQYGLKKVMSSIALMYILGYYRKKCPYNGKDLYIRKN